MIHSSLGHLTGQRVLGVVSSSVLRSPRVLTTYSFQLSFGGIVTRAEVSQIGRRSVSILERFKIARLVVKIRDFRGRRLMSSLGDHSNV